MAGKRGGYPGAEHAPVNPKNLDPQFCEGSWDEVSAVSLLAVRLPLPRCQ